MPQGLNIKPARIDGYAAVYLIADWDYTKFYVGISADPYRRFVQHKNRKKWPEHLHIIEYVLSDQADSREIHWIATFLSWGFPLDNKNDGGKYSTRSPGGKMPDVVRDKIRRARIGVKRPDVSKALKGRKGQVKLSEETKKRMSDAAKNRDPAITRKWIDAGIAASRGTKMPEDQKVKISQTLKVYWKEKKR